MMIKKLKRKSLFIILMEKKNMLKTDSDVSINDIIKSFTKAYNGID